MIGPSDWFTGQVRIEPLFPASEDINASGAYVTFAPGARSVWHTHPAGQRLVVTSGVGLTQEWGKPVQVMRPGDVVFCSPGVKHWHGAAPTHAMTHLAVTGFGDGKLVTWMEKVADEQYNATGAAVAEPERKMTTTETALSIKQQTIPLIASFMPTSDMPKLNVALNEGLDAGLTISEAKEILVQLYAYVGFPVASTRSVN